MPRAAAPAGRSAGAGSPALAARPAARRPHRRAHLARARPGPDRAGTEGRPRSQAAPARGTRRDARRRRRARALPPPRSHGHDRRRRSRAELRRPPGAHLVAGHPGPGRGRRRGHRDGHQLPARQARARRRRRAAGPARVHADAAGDGAGRHLQGAPAGPALDRRAAPRPGGRQHRAGDRRRDRSPADALEQPRRHLPARELRARAAHRRRHLRLRARQLGGPGHRRQRAGLGPSHVRRVQAGPPQRAPAVAPGRQAQRLPRARRRSLRLPARRAGRRRGRGPRLRQRQRAQPRPPGHARADPASGPPRAHRDAGRGAAPPDRPVGRHAGQRGAACGQRPPARRVGVARARVGAGAGRRAALRPAAAPRARHVPRLPRAVAGDAARPATGRRELRDRGHELERRHGGAALARARRRVA